MIINNPNYYYQVDGQRVTSKPHALLLAGGDYSRIHFYNMEHVWDNVDWSHEPTETFEELCDARCRQLREQYDHLCLWLSAGYDSQTILASFIRNGIIIDEIGYMDRGEYYNDPEIPFVLACISDYKKLYNPKLRVNVVKITYDYTRSIYLNLKDEWVLAPADGLRLSKSTASFVQNYHPDVLRNRDATSKSRADIYGKEKPKLNLRDGAWYMQSNDSTVKDTINAPIVEFYIPPDMPELYVKQCHMAINFFESIPGINHDLVHKIQSMDREYYQRWNVAVGRVIPKCPESLHGDLKAHFSTGIKSFDSERIFNESQANGDSAFKHYKSGFNMLLENIGQNTSLARSVLGKDWKIREFRSVDNKIN